MALDTASMNAEGRALRRSQLTRVLALISLEGGTDERFFSRVLAVIRQQYQASTT
jgi:hypothetical protein